MQKLTLNSLCMYFIIFLPYRKFEGWRDFLYVVFWLRNSSSSAVTNNDLSSWFPSVEWEFSKVEVDGGASKSDDTVEGVVVAADGLLRAIRARCTNDGDRGASYTDLASDGPEGDAQKCEKSLDDSTVRTLNRIAALEGTGVALTGRRDRIGGSKERESE